MSGSPRRATRTQAPALVAALALPALVLLSLADCAPDLRETTGPTVAVPNLTGRVVRAGLPVADVKVKLLESASDSTMDEDRTGPDGRFAFTGVGAGDWTLRTSGNQPGDFARVTWEFVQPPDSVVQAPDLDVYPGGLELVQPADGDTVDLPSFFRPLVFQWRRPDREGCRVEARVFDAADSAVWYSDKMYTTEVRWNGLANKGTGAGHPVEAGGYTWELRIDWNSNPEYTTEPRRLYLRKRTP